MKDDKNPAIDLALKLGVIVLFGCGFLIETPYLAFLYGIVFTFVALLEVGSSMDDGDWK